jgi:hypothetical protein
MCIGFHVKYPLFMSNFNETLIFFHRLLKNTLIPNFMKICPVGAELFYAERQTDGDDKANSHSLRFFRCSYKKVTQDSLLIVVTQCSGMCRCVVG